MKKRRIAFVVQRCGREVNGGRSALSCDSGKNVGHWDVEILTSCAVDYVTWRTLSARQEELGVS